MICKILVVLPGEEGVQNSSTNFETREMILGRRNAISKTFFYKDFYFFLCALVFRLHVYVCGEGARFPGTGVTDN